MSGGVLEETLITAGAAFTTRAGVRVAAHFGSVAAEMAVCRHGVGLSDRSDDGTIELRGTPEAVAAVVERVTGERLVPGRALRSCGAWWCPVTRHRVLVVAERSAAADLGVVLTAAARLAPGASVMDLTDDYAAIALVGPRARRVVRDAGLLPTALMPLPGAFLPATETVRPGLLLCQDVDHLVLLVPAAHARAAWAHLMAAGRPHGVTCVGREALERLDAVAPPVSLS